MPRERTDVGWLWDMLDAAKTASGFVQGKSFADYESDRLLKSAVERQIEIIGEAARRVSDDFQTSHPEIPSRPIIAQRHVLAHEYGELRQDLIWRVVTIHVPELINALSPLVPEPPNDTSIPPSN